MKTLFKNFIHVLRKFKVSSLLNILGLSIAFASFILIAIVVNYEFSFDKYHSNAKHIYRVDNVNRKTGDVFSVIHPRALVETFIQSSPQIKAGTLLTPPYNQVFFKYEQGGMQQGAKESIVTCHPDITKIFDFQLLAGQADCLESPENVMIPESKAIKLFGNTQAAIGKELTLSAPVWMKENAEHLIVGGIYKDLPENTQLSNVIYTAVDQTTSVNDWSSSNFICYVLLDDNASPEQVAANYNAHVDIESEKGNNIAIKLTPLVDIYYMNEFSDSMFIKSGSLTNTFILITIAFVIILIAIINFSNFSMALAPIRLKSVTTRKVLGSSTNALRAEIMGEAVLFGLVSFGLALALVYLLAQMEVFSFVPVSILPQHNLLPVIYAFLIAIVSGLIAGVRPAFYISSFPPALALKGTVGASPSGRKTRTLLVGFQFAASLILIICTTFIFRQNQFVRNYVLGYDTEQTMMVELDMNTIKKNLHSYEAKLKDSPDVVDVSFSNQQFGGSDNYMFTRLIYKDEDISFNYLPVAWNFPSMMDIAVLQGRTFLENEENTCLINRSVSEKYNIEVGSFFQSHFGADNLQVVGIIDDVKITSLREEVPNIVLVSDSYFQTPFAYIKLRPGADYQQVIRQVEKVVSELDPAYPVKVEFYDQLFDQLYRKEQNTANHILFFSLLAIAISMMGVFGLVLFENQYRRKEIGIRKVLGSTEYEILRLLNKIYLQTFLISLIVAIPVVVYIMQRWLDNFAYKISLSWWVFILASLPILLLIVTTVSVQSYRSAVANPVDSLKSE